MGRYRIPDVCVVTRDYPIEPVFKQAPLICLEILSRDDTLRTMKERIDDYRRLGVPHIRILDPGSRQAWICTRTGVKKLAGTVLTVPGTPIKLDLTRIFGDLD